MICSVLRGTPSRCACPEESLDVATVLRVAEAHGVTLLLDWRLGKCPESHGWPTSLVEALRASRFPGVVAELALRSQLRTILSQLSDAGVRYLLLKGTPLAYSLYEEPYLRPRGDTDILIHGDDRSLAHAILVHNDFEAQREYGRRFASYQRNYINRSQPRHPCNIDLHWRLSNSQIFAQALGFEELWENSIVIDGLGRGIRAPDAVYALIVALLHRATHINAPYFVDGQCYFEANRLIWLRDIDLLTKELLFEDWRRFSGVVAEKKVRAVCLDGLVATQEAFHSEVPEEVLQRLAVGGVAERSAVYLRRGLWRTRFMADLPAMESWAKRVSLLWEWMFPTAAHMYKKYSIDDRRLLPFLYVRRALVGLYNAITGRRA
jgi:hypothetical protein